MKINKLLVTSLSLILVAISCTKKEDVGSTSTVNMAGEWFTEYYDAAVPNVALTGHDKTLTYNTASNDGKQIWVDDHSWAFKAKMNIDNSKLSFSAMDSTLDILASYHNRIKVYDGKVLPKMGKSKSGNVVDSIYLKVEFLDDDPGVIYEIRGHQRTGFFEDEY